MDIATLMALYPVVKDVVNRAPQLRSWIEKKAKEEDPTLFMQLQLMEAVTQLRTYTLTTAIMSAMLANPELEEEQIKERFIRSVEVARDIQATISGISP